MPSRRSPAPKAREHEIQKAIVDALRLAGLTVLETTAYRQKGASGVDKGIPDLLVGHPDLGPCWLGMEVKTAQGELTPEQAELHRAGLTVVVRSVTDALDEWKDWIEFRRHWVIEANPANPAVWRSLRQQYPRERQQ